LTDPNDLTMKTDTRDVMRLQLPKRSLRPPRYTWKEDNPGQIGISRAKNKYYFV
jgi:hypothetical protein